MRLFSAAALALLFAQPGASQERVFSFGSFRHFGARAAAMSGAFTAVASDATAFYWNPAGYAFGPAAHGGVQWAEGDSDRGDGSTFSGEAAGFSIGLPFLGVAGTSFDESSSIARDGTLSSYGLESFDLSVSILQSLPIDDLVIAGNIHYLRGDAHELFEPLASLSSGERTPSAVRERVLESGGESSSTASLDLGALYQPNDRMRFGLMWRRLFEPGFRLPSGEELVLPRHGRVGAAFFLPHATTLAVDFDLMAHGADGEDWRELSFGVEKRFFDDRLSLRAGLRAEAGGDHGARPGFSAGAGVRIRFLVLDAAYQGAEDDRDEALLFGVTVSP